MKKLLIGIITFAMVFSLAGCGSSKNDADSSSDVSSSPVQLSGENTLGNKLGILFLADVVAGKDKMEIAQELGSNSGYDCVTAEVSEGYLNGFTDEVKGFTSGVQFAPMIGSIPFVGYIFETDDPKTLMATLKAQADPRWNICTEAAETVCIKEGKYVFFAMCPGDDE